MRYFLLLILSLTISGPASASCYFKVSGKVTFKDNIFSSSETVDRKLVGARVIILGSLGKHLPFLKWGSDRTNSKGEFVLNKKILTFCQKQRRFKVQIEFIDDKVRIEDGAMLPFIHMALQTGKKGTRKNGNWKVNLGTIGLNETKYRATPYTNGYYANRNAILWRAYHIQFDTLKKWKLTPKRIVVIHPEGPGTQGWADFISNRTRLRRQWFDLETNTRLWAQTEAVHEPFHIWWNQHFFTPNFLTGKSGYTHEFVESQDLGLYEAFAEWAANVLNRDVYGTPTMNVLYPISRKAIYDKFAAARKRDAVGNKTSKHVWPNKDELKKFFREEPKAFKKQFWATEVVAANYLNILTTEDWHKRHYGDLEHTSVANEVPTCGGVPKQLFTPKTLMRKLIAWRSSKKMKPGKAGIKHFMKYLRDTNRTFRKYHRLVVDLGKPGKTTMPKEACSKRRVRRNKGKAGRTMRKASRRSRSSRR